MSTKTQIKIPTGTNATKDNFYTQSAGGNESRTYIPGMKRKSDGTNKAEDVAEEQTSEPLHIILQSRPVAGILYSVSRDNCGEVFPIYVGRNLIGCEPECDVYLTEETVSPNHAVLLIRVIPLKDGGKKVTMSISDHSSDFGTAVNGEQISDDIQSISAGDIIQIGNSYQFVFIPLDADKYDLKPVAGFVATPRVENRPVINNDYMAYMLPPTDNTIYPDAVGEEDELTFYGRSKKAKEDHSNKKTL